MTISKTTSNTIRLGQDALTFAEQLKQQIARLGWVDADASERDYTTALSRVFAEANSKSIGAVWGGIDRVLQGSSPRLSTFFLLLPLLGGTALIEWRTSKRLAQRCVIASIEQMWQAVNARSIAYSEDHSGWIPDLARQVTETSSEARSLQAQIYRLLQPDSQTNRTLAKIVFIIEAMEGTLQIAWTCKLRYVLQVLPASEADLRETNPALLNPLRRKASARIPPLPASQLETIVYSLNEPR